MKTGRIMGQQKICKFRRTKLSGKISNLRNVFFFLVNKRYVIKAVVYEIGILTEADENSTSDDYS